MSPDTVTGALAELPTKLSAPFEHLAVYSAMAELPEFAGGVKLMLTEFAPGAALKLVGAAGATAGAGPVLRGADAAPVGDVTEPLGAEALPEAAEVALVGVELEVLVGEAPPPQPVKQKRADSTVP